MGSKIKTELSLQDKLEGISNERFIHYDLDRFTAALKDLGNPERIVKTLVIGGTNGKGTTTLLISAALLEAGFQVGTYLSPHLQSPNERLLHNLTPVNEALLGELVDRHRDVAEKYRLTYFEYLTLLMFVWAAKANLDFLVLEVGLGGRLDATNVTHPIASLITNIDWDHQQFLGNSLEAILREKFAIVRPESLCFTGIRNRALAKELIDSCDAIDAIYYFTNELRQEVVQRDWHGQSIRINGHPFDLTTPTPGTVENALLAFLALRIVFPKMAPKTMRDAFARVRHPGRFEVMQEDPLVILSGDHNPAGIECLAQTLAALPKRGRLKVLCGFSPDKPFLAMYSRLSQMADEIKLTVISNIKTKLPASYYQVAPVQESPRATVEEMVRTSSREDVIVVTGSLYLVGEVRSLWKKKVEFLTTPRITQSRSALAVDDATSATPRREEAGQTTARQAGDAAH